MSQTGVFGRNDTVSAVPTADHDPPPGTEANKGRQANNGSRSTNKSTTPAKQMPSGPSLQTGVPVLLFIAVNRVAGLRWAVIAATLWSLKLLVDRRRSGIPLGVFMPIITAAVLIRGAIGAITESESLYFGLGIATKYTVVIILLASIAVRRPLALYGAPAVLDIPTELETHHRYRSAMVYVTAIVALYYMLSATFDVWLFRRSSVEGFVIWRFLANWPLSAAALGAVLGVTHLHLRSIPELPALPQLFEQRMAEYWPDNKPRKT